MMAILGKEKGIKVRISRDITDESVCREMHGHPIDLEGRKVCVFVTDEEGKPVEGAQVMTLGGGKVVVLPPGERKPTEITV